MDLDTKPDDMQRVQTTDSDDGMRSLQVIDSKSQKNETCLYRVRCFLYITALPLIILAVILVILLSGNDDDNNGSTSPDHYLSFINLPSSDFHIEFYSAATESNITKPRALRSALYDGSTITYVGSSDFLADQAYVMIDYDSDGTKDAEFVIFEASSVNNSYSPASVALSNDGNHNLYIALPDSLILCDGNVHEKVLEFESNNDRLDCNIILNIPLSAEDAQKNYLVRRYIGFSPSKQLCMANGVTCDNCARDGADLGFPHGTIICFKNITVSAMMNTNMSDANDANIEVIADGVRNSAGFDWHPNDETFYFTDNGRDEIHEKYPDDELNKIQGSSHFGFPQCHTLGSGNVELRDFNCSEFYIDPNITNKSSIDCEMYHNAMQPLGPHVVPLGMRFYDKQNYLPDRYDNVIFIAERGSGDTDSDSFGYRIVAVRLSNDQTQVLSHEVFADGFYEYENDTIIGRPADVEILPDGSILVSDDTFSNIYRITYDGKLNVNDNSNNVNAVCNFSYAL